MGFKEHKVHDEVAPNLVPMIDIMFLLLLFFMLNANFDARATEEMVSPIAKNADERKKDEKQEGSGSRVTVNIHHLSEGGDKLLCPTYKAGKVCREDAHWLISVQGRRHKLVKEDLEKLKSVFLDLARPFSEDKSKPGSKSERVMVIRADRQAPYGYIQKTIEQLAGAGLYKIEVGVEKPAPEKPKG
jgi:biopolymer transport protein ExbD